MGGEDGGWTLTHHRRRRGRTPTLTSRTIRLRPNSLQTSSCVASRRSSDLIWNVLTGRARGTGIKDYDLIYFDDDLSWTTEDAVIRRVAAAARGCVGPIEARNQARVHLWFESRFGTPYPRLASADEALRRYASVVHAVGVRLEDVDRLDVAAPFGLDDLFAMVIRPNRVLDNAMSHTRKAQRALAIWPEVTVLPWDEAACA
jgi:hypothetical protein